MMRYCSAGVLWRGRCVLAWGIGEMWPKYGSTAGTFGVFPSWNFDALCFISMGFGGVGVCVVVECVTPGSQVITLSIQGAAREGGQLYESQHTVA